MAEQPPMPKSPPGLYAKRRHQAKLQVLEREIGFLQEELKSLDKVQPTSRCCKEISEFIATKSDPLIAIDQKSNESDCCSCSCRGISKCCRSGKDHNRQGRKSCCCSRQNCCPKGCGCSCGIKGCCSCFSKNCCLFKLCSSNCCKLKLCPKCASCRSCCC